MCYLLIRLFTLSNDSHQEESLLSLCVPPKKKKDFGPFISLLKHLRRFSQQPHASINHSADETRVSREDSASIGLIVLLRVMFIAKIQTFPKPRRNRHFVQECQSTPQEDNSEFQYLKNIAWQLTRARHYQMWNIHGNMSDKQAPHYTSRALFRAHFHYFRIFLTTESKPNGGLLL